MVLAVLDVHSPLVDRKVEAERAESPNLLCHLNSCRHVDQLPSSTCCQSADTLDTEAVVVVKESVLCAAADGNCNQVVDPCRAVQSDRICNKRLYKGEPHRDK